VAHLNNAERAPVLGEAEVFPSIVIIPAGQTIPSGTSMAALKPVLEKTLTHHGESSRKGLRCQFEKRYVRAKPARVAALSWPAGLLE
jgi:hypothetical protein